MNSRKPEIWQYTFCYNEMKIIPFAAEYWKRYVTKLIVFDNGSTDGSIEYLKNLDFCDVEIRPLNTGNQINDDIYRRYKNECWKEAYGLCDFVVVCDMDEVIFGYDIETTLKSMLSGGYSMAKMTGLTICSKIFPEHKENTLLHEQEYIHVYRCGEKDILFSPNKINAINYSHGAHSSNPAGYMKPYMGMYFIHICDLGADYLIEKYRIRRERLSEINKRNGWGIHYLEPETKVVQDLLRNYENSTDFLTFIHR